MKKNSDEFSFLGDMNEEYSIRYKKKGETKAQLWYCVQILINFPAFLKDSIYWSYQMLRNYLLITLRNIKRNKGFSFINVFGLALGMAACLLILLWVKDEISFNRFHDSIDNIYLTVSERVNCRGEYFDTTPVPLAEPLRNNFPDIAKVVRFQFRNNILVQYGEKIFNNWKGAYVDPEIFEVFTFPFLKGNADSAFENKNTIVLTQTSARKFFSDEDPLGKMIELDGDLLEVNGIIKDIPKNSDIQVDYFRPFISMKELTEFQHFIWNWFACHTYVQLKEGIDPAAVNPKIADLLNTNRTWSNDPLEVSLFPLKKLHLHALGGGGPIKYIYIFTIVAVLILFIACINFMNLSTARSAKRAKEVGLRKIVGSNRLHLVKQFFLESIVFSIVSVVIALLLVYLIMPWFNLLSGKQLSFNMSDTVLILGLLAIAILTGVVAGIYPALVLSSFKPVDVLKGSLLIHARGHKTASMPGRKFRQVLVITQFVLSIGLIICALLIFKQLNFMRHADMGFDKDNLVRISIPEKHQGKWEALKTDLAQSMHISGITAVSSQSHGGSINWDGASGDLQYLGTNTVYRMVDFDYIDTYKSEILEGRNFSRDFSSDVNSAYLINEEAVKKWGFKDPINKRFSLNGNPGIVIGIFKNQHFGLKHEVRPYVLYLSSKTDWDRYNYLTARLKANHITEALEDIQKTCKAHITDIPIEFHFLDDLIDDLYQTEERLSGLINTFTLLAIVISCLGLFGMSSFMAQQKTREIGIRKVMGASVYQIVFLLTKEFVRWVLIANVIAWPAAYFAMRSWLNIYPYRIKIGPDIFIFSALAALVIALMTVLYQSLKAAMTNPVNSLKYE
ncbi:MAG: ABC transporter permease [Candidatus Aminicenantes bacterium]|nr:ABC transporter permease [Candidatus Aminicenantes bacterium]